MPDNYPAEQVDYRQLLTRLSALYERSLNLREASSSTRQHGVVSASKLDQSKVLRSRLESVEDSLSGTEYAVWAIGETLCAIGGVALMSLVANRFEDEHGSRGAVWLDHRWNDVQARGDIWLA